MSENLYLNHIESIPSLLDDLFETLSAEALRVAEIAFKRDIESVYLFGSGDSWSAALGATGAISELCHIPAIAIPSLSASRYAPGYCLPVPEKTFVIGISNSGKMIRGVEAVMAMANAGYKPVLLTGNPDSPGGCAADEIFKVQIPAFDPVPIPGVRSYAAAQLALFLFAVHLGKLRETISASEADTYIEYLSGYGERLRLALDSSREAMQAFAELCAAEGQVDFMSFGPCKAAGDFGRAKTYEAVGYHAASLELEESAHMNFFANNPTHIPTVLFSSNDARGKIRCLEIEKSLAYQYRPTLVMTDSDEFIADAAHTVKVPYPLDEKFAPLDFCVLVAELTAYMPLLEGDDYMHGHRGPYFEGPFKEGEGFPTIMLSKIVL